MTTDDARAYLSEIGLEPPAAFLALLIEQAGDADACMDANGYSEAAKELVRYHLLALLTISSGARRVSSQSAPSGASRSYTNAGLIDLHRSLVAGLRNVDPSGCASGLIPAEPGANAALFVVKGRRCG